MLVFKQLFAFFKVCCSVGRKTFCQITTLGHDHVSTSHTRQAYLFTKMELMGETSFGGLQLGRLSRRHLSDFN